MLRSNLWLKSFILSYLLLSQVSVVDIDDAAVETDLRDLVVGLQKLAKLKKVF